MAKERRPRAYMPGDVVGYYKVLVLLPVRGGPHRYLVADIRCGCEREVTDSSSQRFKGAEARCSCIRTEVDGHGYVRWRWQLEGKQVNVQEHRIVMEGLIGRELVAGENVHHINGDRGDSRPENLELWNTSQPAGQRPQDKVEYAKAILRLYEPEALREEEA